MSGEILQREIVKPKNWLSRQWAKYKKSVVYITCFVILFKLLNWGVQETFKDNPTAQFSVSQIGYLVFGVLHFFVFYKFLTWADKKSLKPLKEVGFTFLLLAFAYGLMFIKRSKTFPFIEHKEGVNNFAWSVIPFIIPFLLMKAWDFWEAIPQRKYKSWQYPAGMKPPFIQPQKNALILKFKIDTIKEGTLFKDPFDYEMDHEKTLGDHMHFYFFHHNAKYTGEKTLLISDPVNNIPYDWGFYTYNFLGMQRVLDFSIPVKDLNLKMGTVVEVQNI